MSSVATQTDVEARVEHAVETRAEPSTSGWLRLGTKTEEDDWLLDLGAWLCPDGGFVSE
jgi:hypothetical protein